MKIKPIAGTLLVAFAFFSLYLATRTWTFSYDALTSVLTTERNGTFPFHPNHLFGNGLGWLFFKGLTLTGTPVRAIFVFQTTNAAIGAIAVGVLFYVLTIRFSLLTGFLGAMGLGLSYAFWAEVVDAGAYASAGLLAVILTGWMIRTDDRQLDGNQRSSPLAAGLLTGVGVLFHQMLILTIPAFLTLFFSDPKTRGQGKWRVPSLFLGGFFLAGLVPYILIARFYYGFGVHEGLFWFFGPAGPRPNSGIITNSWWQWSVVQNIVPLWTGWANSLIAPSSGPQGWAHWAGQTALAFALLSLCLGTFQLWMKRPRRRPLVSAVLVWIVAMTVFQFFWVPGTIRFRILFLPVMILWVCLVIEGLTEGKDTHQRKFRFVFLALLIGVGLSNGVGTIRPAALLENNRDIRRALWIQRTMGSTDFFLFAGTGDSMTNVIPPYFAPTVPSRSLYGYFFGNPAGDFSEIGTTINQTLLRGGDVYMEEQLFKKETWKGLAPNEESAVFILSKWFSTYEPTALLSGPFQYRVVKIRRRFIDAGIIN